MKNMIFAKAAKRVAVLFLLIICLVYLRSPQQASASTCTQNCDNLALKCDQSCHGVGGCFRICSAALQACLAGCW